MKAVKLPFLKNIGMAIVSIISNALIAIVICVFVMLLWNYVMASVLKLPELSFWNAFALTYLFRLLLPTDQDCGCSDKKKPCPDKK